MGANTSALALALALALAPAGGRGVVSVYLGNVYRHECVPPLRKPAAK